jgi:hypothetical protein
MTLHFRTKQEQTQARDFSAPRERVAQNFVSRW